MSPAGTWTDGLNQLAIVGVNLLAMSEPAHAIPEKKKGVEK